MKKYLPTCGLGNKEMTVLVVSVHSLKLLWFRMFRSNHVLNTFFMVS